MAVDIIARLKLSGQDFSRQFNSQFDAIENKAKTASSRISTAWGKMNSALGVGSAVLGGVVVSAVAAAAKQGLDYAASLGETAAQLGVNTKFLQEYRFAATQAGASTEKADAAIGSFTLTLGKAREGGKAQVDAFAKLGVAINDANGKARDSEAVFTDVADAIAKIEDPTRRSTASQAIFLKGYKAVLPVLEAGASGWRASAKEAEKFGMIISEEEIQNADNLADKIDKLQQALNTSTAKTVSSNSKALGEFVDGLSDLVLRTPAAIDSLARISDQFSIMRGIRASGLGLMFEPGRMVFNALAGDAPVSPAKASSGPVKPVAPAAFMKNATPSRYMRSNFVAQQYTSSIGEDFAAFMAAPDPSKGATKDQVSAYKDISKELAAQVESLREAARLDEMRAAGKEAEADKEAALLDIRREYSDLLAGEPAAAAKALGITEDQVEALRNQLGLLQQITAEQADAKAEAGAIDAENRAADVARKATKEWNEERQRDEEQRISDLADFYERAFRSGGKSIWADLKAQGMRTIAQLAAQFTLGMVSGGGGGFAGLLQGTLGSVFGGGGGGSGGPLSLFSGSAGAGGFGAVGGGIGGGLPGASGGLSIGGMGFSPVSAGLLALPLIGSLLGSLKTKKGSATLGFADGGLGVGSSRGNSSSRIEAAKSGISSIADTLTSIAETLGGSITGAGSVSIGVRKKTYVVDPTGAGRTKGSGVLKFKDEEEAIRAAISEALRDGVVAGISDASQRILQSGQQLEKALAKASLIEAIPKTLKARLNPVGAALDALNAKWDETIAALKEGAATAEQMADAEKLYRLERADALAAANDNLKDFINALNFGSASTYSVGDQEKAARAALDPYLSQIRSGDFAGVDSEKYLAAADAWLQIKREIDGSGTGWFGAVDELKSATQSLADGISAQTGDNAAARDPFGEIAAAATTQTAANTLASAEILAQHTLLLDKIASQLGVGAASSAAAAFIGSDRAFLSSEAA